MKLKITQIIATREAQARLQTDPQVVEEYKEAMEQGTIFPLLVVFAEDGDDLFWLGDGFHRLAAYEKLGIEEVEVEVKRGGKRDAILYAVGANSSHGLRRSNADKRRSVQILLLDPEWSQWSDREIARKAGVSDFMVRQIRCQLRESRSSVQLRELKRKGADGKIRKIPSQKEKISYCFPIIQESKSLERLLHEQFEKWPEDKRHSFCIHLRNFSLEKDPEAINSLQKVREEEKLTARNQDN